MRTSSDNFARPKRPAMTLIEVVVGLALLGSLLVSLLLAKVRLSHQRIEAENRLMAIRAADDLLSEWSAQGTRIPRQSTGRAGPGDQFRWSTHVIRNQRVQDMSLQVVRLELTDDEATNHRALASVELLLPPEGQAQ